MSRVFIPDIADSRLDPYRDLKQASKTRWTRHVIAEGWRVTERMLKSDLCVESVLMSERRLEALEAIVPAELPLLVVSQAVAEQLVGFNFHAGVLAAATRPPRVDFATWARDLAATDTVVALPNVADPDNVGLIMRTAAALGVRKLLLGSGSSSPYSRRSLRLSMGGVFQLSIFESSQISAHLQELATTYQFGLYASLCDPDAVPIDREPILPRACLVLGNESEGLAEEFANLCPGKITIPMAEGVDSLNVSTAAGVILYEWNRQRRSEGGAAGHAS